MTIRPQNRHLKPIQPGEVRNPAGRPKGSRNKLNETFMHALAEDFALNGRDVIEKVRTERPQDYLKVIAAVLPKRMEIEDATPARPAAELTDDELAAIISGSNGTEKTLHRSH